MSQKKRERRIFCGQIKEYTYTTVLCMCVYKFKNYIVF